MSRWHIAGWLALGCLSLTACAEQPPAVSPQDAVARLRTGMPLLSCRDACLAGWRHAAPQAAQLDAAGRWGDLAALVLTVGYQDDLTLYYLGRAGEGLGYPGAAASYYRQSTYLSGTAASCQAASQLCGGIVLPKAALLRLAAIDRELGPPRYRRARPAARTPATAEPAPNEAQEVIPLETPAPPAIEPTPPPVPVIPPPVRRAAPAGSDYIEPPPAPH